MSLVISFALKLLVCVVASSFFISESEGVNPPFGNRHVTHRRVVSTSNNSRSLGRVAALHRTGGQSLRQRDDGSSRGLAMNDQPVGDFDEEEERYVPASFNIDDYGAGADTGNRFFNGHAIEMMAPVEIPEYGWNEDSRGLSELENGDDVQPVNHGNVDDDEGEYFFSTPATNGLNECGGKQIDPRHALCCNGLVFRKSAEDQGKCCGSVAYDDRFFTCCQGRAIVRKAAQMPLCCGDYTTDSLPDQCRFGYERDSTGLGSTCCRSASGSWTCCLKGESCCTGSAVDRSTAIEVPGFRPACCHLNNEDLTAQCCATTYEKIRVLPDCCERDRLKPVCCQVKGRPIKCCPGTVGYCCGGEERPVRPTVVIPPEFRLQSTRAPSFTYPARPSYTQRPPVDPRPSYTQRPPVDPRPSYTQRPPIDPRPSYTQRPPIDPRPSYTQRPPVDPRPSYTQRPPVDPRPTHAPGSSYTTGYPFPIAGQSVTPRDRLLHTTAALPLCCIKKAPVRQCCSGATKSPACCQSAKLQARTCCLTFSFNPTCCRTHMQQQQQQQQQHQQPQQLQSGQEIADSTNTSPVPDVIPVDAVHTAGRDGNHDEPIQPVADGRYSDTAPHDARGDLRQHYQPSSDTRNGHRSRGGPPPQATGSSNGRSTDGKLTDSGLQSERQKVAHSCCRLGSRLATACCQNGYQETGRLPACCIASPVDNNHEPNDADPTMLNQGLNHHAPQELRLAESQQVTRKPRRVGQKNPPKDTLVNVGSSKVATGRKVKTTATSGRPCNETSFAEEEFICCNNVLRKRIGVLPSCCNTIAYDQLLYTCCDGKVRVSCRPDYKPKKSVWGVSV